MESQRSLKKGRGRELGIGDRRPSHRLGSATRELVQVLLIDAVYIIVWPVWIRRQPNGPG